MNVIRLPRVVEKIINKLEAAGFEAYAVGGCVRDSILGRVPGDWDITTSATPEEVKRVFQRTIDTGIEHGTVTVLMGGEDTLCDGVRGYEVTTYRIDGDYADGRHPKQVTFTPSLEEDMARRDFTVNAMAYNPKTGIVDAFGGLEDLEQGIIRAVGRAEHRFHEDALRMLRALRFSAQLGFAIETETYEAVKQLAPNLGKVSKERIAVELTKLLMSDHPERIVMVFDTGLAPYICEDFPKIRDAGPGNSSCPTDGFSIELPVLPKRKKYLCWGLFLRDVPQYAAAILKELKLDNDTIKKASIIAGLFQRSLPADAYEARKLISEIGYTLYFDYLDAREPLTHGATLAYERSLGREIREKNECISLRDMAVTGQDLMDAGIPRGPEVGRVLGSMFEEVLREPAHNERAYLMERYVHQHAQLDK